MKLFGPKRVLKKSILISPTALLATPEFLHRPNRFPGKPLTHGTARAILQTVFAVIEAQVEKAGAPD
jgi:hypothetical protein